MDVGSRGSSFPGAWTGYVLGLLFSLFTAADLALRPKFVPVFEGAEVMEHVTPPLLTASHALLNLLMALLGVVAGVVYRADLRKGMRVLPIFAALITAVLLSSLYQPEWKTLVYSTMLALTLVGALLWSVSEAAKPKGLKNFLVAVCLGSSLVLVGALLVNEYSWGRLVSRAGPNFWGMVAFTAFCASLTIRSRLLRSLIIALCLVMLSLAQARGSMLATAAASFSMILFTYRHAPRRRQGFYLTMAAIVGLTTLLALPTLAEKVLLLDDPRRGVSSGGTGRAEAWGEALEAFSRSPLFGIGYRQHEQYITVASNAHNAYIAVLTELGMAGLAVYVLMLIGGAIRISILAWRDANVSYQAIAAFLWGFIAIGLIEYQAIALGSPMPLLMIFLVAVAWTAGRAHADSLPVSRRKVLGTDI
jgi:O-antigen ligase